VPTTDIVYVSPVVAAEVVNSRIDVCDPPGDRETIDGISRGSGGLTPEVNVVAVRFTDSENPFRLARVIRNVALDPAGVEMNEGLEVMVKSG
jgi:hypothetical protein